MSRRDDILAATRQAAKVHAQFDVRRRIDAGYTRVDPDTIADQAGVVVLYKELDRLLGGFIREEERPGIMVNVARSRGLVHMTAAHELGHFFMGHQSTADETIDYGSTADVKEQQANYFAYNLLTPQWLVARTMKRMRWSAADLARPHVLYQLSLRLGVSYTAMVWSLVRMGVMAETRTTALLKVQPRQIKLESLRGLPLIQSTRDVWVLSKADQDTVIEPAPGDQFVVALPNHADAGHLWTVDELRTEGFSLQPIAREPAAPSMRGAKEHVVGGTTPTLKYSLTPSEGVTAAADAHTHAAARLVALVERTPWAPQAPASDDMSLRTEFELVQSGFSRAERERRIAEVQARQQ